jgi:hypothetical protein
MRLQVFGDLHVDYRGSRGTPPLAAGVGAVVVAGDTCEGLATAVRTLRHAYPLTEIITVAGNHESWSKKWSYDESSPWDRKRPIGSACDWSSRTSLSSGVSA